MSKISEKLKFLKSKFFIFIYFVILAIILCSPASLYPRSLIIGYNDAWQFVWNFWWFKTALFNLHTNPFYTTYLHFPDGISLLFHTVNLANTIPAIIFQYIFGEVQTYNLLVIFNLALTGFAVYLLGLYLTKNKFAGFIAGLIVAFSSYMVVHAWGHLNLISFGWPVLFILFYLKMTKKDGNWKLPTIFLIITGLTDWYYFFFVILFVSLHLIYSLIAQRRIFEQQFIKNIIITLLLSLMVLSPYLGTMIYLKITNPDFNVPGHDPLINSVDLMAFFVPNHTSIWHDLFSDYWERWRLSWEGVGFIGYSVLALCLFSLIALAKKNKEVIFWGISAFLFFILALGPFLQINGLIYRNITLPYSWLEKCFPLITFSGVPARFAVMMYLSLAMLAALAISSILEERKLWKIIILGLIVIILGVELLPTRVKYTEIGVPEFYQTMAKDKEYYVVMDVSTKESKVLFYQTIHQKKLIAGYTSRPTNKTMAFLAETPVISNIYHSLDFSEPVDAAADRETLKNYQIKYIIIGYRDKVRLNILQELELPIVFQRGKIIVFRVY